MALSHTPSIVWALNETSKDVVAVSKGVLRAATTDDVQPIALMAAEAFGNTLAMSTRTMLIVEKSVGNRHESAVFKHFKASIGWSKHDSAAYLANSGAGIRFLALTAALLTMQTSFDTAQCLERLITASSAKGQMMPTITQINDLIDAVEPKLTHASFANRVVGAETLLGAILPVHHAEMSFNTDVDTIYPSFQQIEALVEATRRLSRVHELENDVIEDESSFVVVKANLCHPWIYAFLEWALGEPPAVVGDIDKTVLSSNKPSKAMLLVDPDYVWTIAQDHGLTMKVELYHSVNNPKQLWDSHDISTNDIGRWSGLVSIPALGQHMAYERKFGFRVDEVAFQQAVGLALQCYYSKCKDSWQLIQHTSYREYSPDHSSHSWPILPPMADIEKVFIMMHGEEAARFLQPYQQHCDSLQSLPLWRDAMLDLEKRCQCRNCSMQTGRLEHRSMANSCEKADAEREVVIGLTVVLSLALFETFCLEGMRVHNGRKYDISDALLTLDMDTIFASSSELGGELPIRPTDLYDLALNLIGVKPTMTGKDALFDFLAVSRQGQVTHLSLLDQGSIRKTCMQRLTCFPGQLYHEGTKIDQIQPVKGCYTYLAAYSNVAVLRPQNLYAGATHNWIISPLKYKSAKLGISMHFLGERYMIDPWQLINLARNSFYISGCEHDPKAELNTRDSFAYFVTGCVKPEEIIPQDGTVQIAATAGNKAHRFWACVAAANAKNRVVVSDKACLECALRLCRQTGTRTLIL